MIADVTVVFDLDGTLVASDEFDGALYVETLREVLGDVEVDESWRSYRHVTDAGVLAEIMERAGVPDVDRLKVQARDLFGSKVERHLAQGGRCECVAGAKAAIEELLAAGCAVGVATGGWGHTARMKLARAGIPFDSLVLTSSDDGSERVEIMGACLRRLGGAPDRAVYVGDGPWDLEASQAAGWRFVGVGEKLKGLCAPWIADFTDPAWKEWCRNALHNAAVGGVVRA